VPPILKSPCGRCRRGLFFAHLIICSTSLRTLFTLFQYSVYSQAMGLFWNDIEIVPGMLLEVDEFNYEVLDDEGRRAQVVWKILALETKGRDEAYYQPSTGRKFSMQKVMKSRKLLKKLDLGELIQIPACTDFLVLQEYHNSKPVLMRCYSLDMLGNIRDIRIASPRN